MTSSMPAVVYSATLLCNNISHRLHHTAQWDRCQVLRCKTCSAGEGGSFNNSCFCKHIKQPDREVERQTDGLTSSSRRTTSVFPQRAAWCSAVPDSDCLLISIPAWISNLQHKIIIIVLTFIYMASFITIISLKCLYHIIQKQIF